MESARPAYPRPSSKTGLPSTLPSSTTALADTTSTIPASDISDRATFKLTKRAITTPSSNSGPPVAHQHALAPHVKKNGASALLSNSGSPVAHHHALAPHIKKNGGSPSLSNSGSPVTHHHALAPHDKENGASASLSNSGSPVTPHLEWEVLDLDAPVLQPTELPPPAGPNCEQPRFHDGGKGDRLPFRSPFGLFVPQPEFRNDPVFQARLGVWMSHECPNLHICQWIELEGPEVLRPDMKWRVDDFDAPLCAYKAEGCCVSTETHYAEGAVMLRCALCGMELCRPCQELPISMPKHKMEGLRVWLDQNV